MLSEKYDLQYVIVSHEPDHWNFSENTDLSEVLVVARKKAPNDPDGDKKTSFVNLWRQPRNAIEALSLASSVMAETAAVGERRLSKVSVGISGKKVGEGIVCNEQNVSAQAWGRFCAFAQSELVLALEGLIEGELHLPTVRKGVSLPLCKISDVGTVGFDRRDIHDGFTLSQRKTAYPAIWGHDASKITSIQQNPNAYLDALDEPSRGRPLRSAEHLWGKASHLLIAERLWLKTMRATSVFVPERVLGNVWWTLCLKKGCNSEDAHKSLTLWLNSSVGILLFLGSRVETRGAWIDMKKPLLEELAVLDIRRIGKAKLGQLSKAFDEIAAAELKPFSEIDSDDTRARIDEVIAGTLGLPDLAILRKLLSREPILCLSSDGLNLQQD
jgi:hypothetical protein